jgi:hypothetical protein
VAGRACDAGLYGIAVIVCVVAGGCSGNDTTAPTTPSAATRTTDRFTGTVLVGGSDFHSFPITATGSIDVTLTAATPPATVVMGIGIGIVVDGKCSEMPGAATQTAAGASVQLSGIVSPGTLCVDVRDLGAASGPVTYSLTVTHP